MSDTSGTIETAPLAAAAKPSDFDIGPRSVFTTAPDGLRLHTRDYGPRFAAALPVVCLPGLSRNSADFHALALALAGDAKTPRRVVALDYRGRGLSEYDPDSANYTLAVELADVIAVLNALEIAQAAFIGTSRGGLLTMLMAAARPAFVAGALLNDIGPAIEARGVLRIKGYVGKLPQPRSWPEAGDILRRVLAGQFPNHTEADWIEAARLTWREEKGQWTLNYDPKLSAALDSVDIDSPLPTMWDHFDALARVPLMVIRGELSDLLSAEGLGAMRTRRPNIEVIEVPHQGHPPSFTDPELIARIAGFLRTCDRAAHV
jgi:pimeloyl-ACP methyl ester carboxylesterase